MRRRLVLALLLGLGGPASAQSFGAGPAGLIPAAEYVVAASAADLYEITASVLMRQASGIYPTVDGFAQEMLTDHHDLTARLRAAAREAGLLPQMPQLTQRQQAMMQALREATQGDRVRLYLEQQAVAHEDALALHRAYADRGDNAALRQVAVAAAAVVEKHIRHLRMVRDGR